MSKDLIDNEQPTERKSVNTIDTGEFDPSSLRLTQNFSALASVKKQITLIQVRKPGNQDYFRVHPDPDYSLQTAVLEFKDDREVFLVGQPLWSALPDELIPKVLYLTINRQGVIRLWPIRLPDEEGKLDDWNSSALEIAELAKKDWVRMTSNRAAGMYDSYIAQGDLPEPEWPELSFTEILKIAFRGKFIRDLEHPALQRLRGEL